MLFKCELWADMDRVNHLWPDIARLLPTPIWGFIHCTYLDAWLHASEVTTSALPASLEVWKPILPKHLPLLRCFLGHSPVLCSKEGYTPMELLQWLKDWPGRELDPNIPHGLPPRPGSRLNLWDVRAANNAALCWATADNRVDVLQFFKDWTDAYPVASPLVCYVENGRWFSRGGKASVTNGSTAPGGEALRDTRLTAHDVKCAIRCVSGGPQSAAVRFLWAWLAELQREGENCD